MTFDGRHLPASRTKPTLHLLLDANTPNLPFGTVSSQLNVPGLVIVSMKITLPVAGSNELLPAVNLLLAGSGVGPGGGGGPGTTVITVGGGATGIGSGFLVTCTGSAAFAPANCGLP